MHAKSTFFIVLRFEIITVPAMRLLQFVLLAFVLLAPSDSSAFGLFRGSHDSPRSDARALTGKHIFELTENAYSFETVSPNFYIKQTFVAHENMSLKGLWACMDPGTIAEGVWLYASEPVNRTSVYWGRFIEQGPRCGPRQKSRSWSFFSRRKKRRYFWYRAVLQQPGKLTAGDTYEALIYRWPKRTFSGRWWNPPIRIYASRYDAYPEGELENISRTPGLSLHGHDAQLALEYDLACNRGFEPTDRGCVDINECRTEQDNCGESSRCQNTLGSFACACLEGYFGDPVQGCVRGTRCKVEGEKYEGISWNAYGKLPYNSQLGSRIPANQSCEPIGEKHSFEEIHEDDVSFCQDWCDDRIVQRREIHCSAFVTCRVSALP